MKKPLAAGALVLCALAAPSPPPADAATIHADGVVCSLADAVVAANTDTAAGGCIAGDPGVDTVVLDADVTLSSADPSSTLHGGVGAGLPDVTGDLVIVAGLGAVIRRDPAFTCDAATSDPVFRFLQLESGSLTLDGLRLEHGCFVAGAASNRGGGIRAAAATDLTLRGVTVGPFGAFTVAGGLQGGFLYTEGAQLTIENSRFESAVTEPAESLQGGLIDSRADATSIRNSVFSDLEATTTASSMQGGVLFLNRGDNALEGLTFEDIDIRNTTSQQGGALYSASAGSLTLRDSSFRRFNVQSTSGASLQGGGLYASSGAVSLEGVIFSDFEVFAGGGCNGGALFSSRGGPFERIVIEGVRCTSDREVAGAAAAFFAGDVVLRDCVFRDNEGVGVTASRGGAVTGDGFARIERCAFVNNRLGPALSLAATDVTGGGLEAGAVELMRNVTFAGNVLEAGDGSSSAQDGGAALGGGFHVGSFGQTSKLAAVTVTDNRVIGGEGAPGFTDGAALGAGFYVAADHAIEVVGSVLAGNIRGEVDGSDAAADDCHVDGGFTSLGFNVVHAPGAGCGPASFGDITGVDPGLYPAADYGCAQPLPDGTCVPTAAIDHTSWAVDWGSCADAGVGDDARRLPRRQDIAGVGNLTADACDAGAFEARDRDGDGVTDVPDLCPDDPDADQSDGDGDGAGDACDACRGDDASGDADGDLVCDDSDVCAGFDDALDADGDGVPDGCDLCAGDDASGDTDGDLVCDDSDVCAGFDDGLDADGDGVPDGCDACAGDDASGDSDGDGTCDDLDASLGDRVWLDDGNGVQDGGEPGVPGVTVRLYSSDAVLRDTVLTDAAGEYVFSPGPGEYYVEVVLAPELAYAPRDRGGDDAVDSDINPASGTSSVLTLGAGRHLRSLDAGLEPAVIGNRVWIDGDGDGLQGDAEPGLPGVAVRLLDADGAVVLATVTGPGGVYGFLGVDTGEYRIDVAPPPGYAFSAADAGSDDLLDSDVDPSSGLGPLFTYEASSASQRWDAGLRAVPLFADGFESGDVSAWTATRGDAP
ncbi:MAG: SdrD B-like domain-containing protein [Acidobacteriota bacterium]